MAGPTLVSTCSASPYQPSVSEPMMATRDDTKACAIPMVH